jgi:hypothetical protein
MKQDRLDNTVLKDMIEKTMLTIQKFADSHENDFCSLNNKVEKLGKALQEKKCQNQDQQRSIELLKYPEIVDQQKDLIRSIQDDLFIKDDRISELEKNCEDKQNQIDSLELLIKNQDQQKDVLRDMKDELLIKDDKISQKEKLCADKEKQRTTVN